MISSTSGRGAPQVSYDPKEGTGIIQPKAGRKHTATVLFMHGLGDTGTLSSLSSYSLLITNNNCKNTVYFYII
jgi:hypothetical protein